MRGWLYLGLTLLCPYPVVVGVARDPRGRSRVMNCSSGINKAVGNAENERTIANRRIQIFVL